MYDNNIIIISVKIITNNNNNAICLAKLGFDLILILDHGFVTIVVWRNVKKVSDDVQIGYTQFNYWSVISLVEKNIDS